MGSSQRNVNLQAKRNTAARSNKQKGYNPYFPQKTVHEENSACRSILAWSGMTSHKKKNNKGR